MTETEYTVRADVSRGILAAVLADLHDSPPEGIFESISRRRPDMILIPGDFSNGYYVTAPPGIKRDVTPYNAIKCLKFCASAAPTYYSIGNHENDITEEGKAFIRSTGVTLLDDSWSRNGEYVIGGLSSVSRHGSQKESGRPDTSWLGSFASEEGFKILLSHHPEHFKKYISGYGIDLTVSGHAHGGQWRFFNRGVFAPGQGLFPALTRGMYFSGRLLVSAGLANTAWFIPRFFNPTEIVYVNIVPKNEAEEKNYDSQ